MKIVNPTKILLWLLFISFFSCPSYAEEYEAEGYRIHYVTPVDSQPITDQDPSVVAAWSIPDRSIRLLIGVVKAPSGLVPRESDLKQGLDQMLGQEGNPFSDWATAKHNYLEAYSPFAIPDTWLYSAIWWHDGIFVKVQGGYYGTDPDASLAYFREYLDHIEIVDAATGQAAPFNRMAVLPAKPAPTSPEDYPRSLAVNITTIGILSLLVVGVIVLIKKLAGSKSRSASKDV